MGLYAGNLNAAEAWDLLSHDQNAALIDVRTEAEWQFAGMPDLSSIGKQVISLQWRNYPNFDLNENFIPTLKLKLSDHNSKLLFLCKVGGRSSEAAIASTQNGFTNCYNIEHGMEGPHDDKMQRGRVAGWKAANLPWRQA